MIRTKAPAARTTATVHAAVAMVLCRRIASRRRDGHQRAEGAHVTFGHGGKQRLVARAAVHVLTVASPARKSFTPRQEISGPVPSAKYAPANHVEHPLNVGLPTP